jgi:type II secretion system protein G
MRVGYLTHSLFAILAGLLVVIAVRFSSSPAVAAPDVANDKAALQDLSHLQVSPTPDGVLVFDEQTGEVLKISPSAKEAAVQRLGAIRKGDAGKWEFTAGAGGGAAADAAKIMSAKTDLSLLETALNTFEVDNGRFPSTEEGLQALIIQPGGLDNWKGPYMKRGIPKDPWGNPYVYQQPGKRNPTSYDLQSFGPDSRDGGADDLTNDAARH